MDLDEIDADEESRWYILGLIPSTESVHDGMLSLGEWHQPVSVEGYLVASNASNAYGYHSSQTGRGRLHCSHWQSKPGATLRHGHEHQPRRGKCVSSSGDADDEWVHGDVPILGRTGFVLMFFIVGIGGAVASFTLSKMFVMKGARDTMKTLLGQVGN